MNFNKSYREGAKGALLDEYERVLDDLHNTIGDIMDEDIIIVVDPFTKDPNCTSVQTVLSHVISAGFNYAIRIKKLRGIEMPLRQHIYHTKISDYQNDIRALFDFTLQTFEHIKDNELEEYDNSKKMPTEWGQSYDIEQMMEHAIVHILRHRRQLEKFIIKLYNANANKSPESGNQT
ncbi:MAG: DinB family protein [Chitinophagales bacterium]